MSSKIKIWLTVLLGLFFFISQAQEFKPGNPVLFTDRDFCVSGDTVWFKVWYPEYSENDGNVVRVQLEGRYDNLIANAAVKTRDDWASGFLKIPDSLSTGQYFISAFLNCKKYSESEIENKSLLVYNRFAEGVAEIEILQPTDNQTDNSFKSPLRIETDKDIYKTREKVRLKIDGEQNIDFKSVVVKVSLIDPLAFELKGIYKFRMKNANPNVSDFFEKDGQIISGFVRDINGLPQSRGVVLLSVNSSSQIYFDYYVLSENGDFHFFIKNATGNSDIVLQVFSEENKQYVVTLENASMFKTENLIWQNKLLTNEQSEFIQNALTANFAGKLFNPPALSNPEIFEFPPRFPVPFYGIPDTHVVPGEFYDLPDFREISRELLYGFQYRVKDDEVSFRILNSPYNVFFDDEPLRLINGIPVFKNELFKNLKSTDIDYIDLVKREQIFGDLIFKGVLSVSLFDKSNSWMITQPNLFGFNYNFLQPEKEPFYMVELPAEKNEPDMRQVYYWRLLQPGSERNIDFYLSDRKGKVEITIEGFTSKNEFFKTSKTIEVK